MRRLLITALLVLAGSAAMAQTKEPIALRDIGSFHLGGRYVDISGKPTREVSIGGASQTPNPNGTYLVEQMYVQYLLPQNRKGKVPLLMWHGGGFTGVTYESTPDGREGWLNLFVRRAGTATCRTPSSAAPPAGRCRKCLRASRCFSRSR